MTTYPNQTIDLDANGRQLFSLLPFKVKKTLTFQSIAQVDTLTLTGTSGTANVGAAGGLTKLATFATSLTITAANFVIAHAAAYLAVGIIVTSDGEDLIFTDADPGLGFTSPTITNATGDLDGTVANTQANGTVDTDEVGDSGGANATSALFTVTGDIMAMVIGVCKKTLVGAATIEVGVAGATAAILPQIANATTLAVNEGWLPDATPSLAEAATPQVHVIGGGLDINKKIASADISYGEIDFYCFFRPLSDDGDVVAA